MNFPDEGTLTVFRSFVAIHEKILFTNSFQVLYPNLCFMFIYFFIMYYLMLLIKLTLF